MPHREQALQSLTPLTPKIRGLQSLVIDYTSIEEVHIRLGIKIVGSPLLLRKGLYIEFKSGELASLGTA